MTLLGTAEVDWRRRPLGDDVPGSLSMGESEREEPSDGKLETSGLSWGDGRLLDTLASRRYGSVIARRREVGRPTARVR